MLEIDRLAGFSTRESGLLVPEKREVNARELPEIFGIDVRLRTQRELTALGILPEGSELQFQERPNIHKYMVIDQDGKNIVVESDGQYFLETVMGEHGVLASYLPPKSHTTEHEHHSPITEIYIQIAGESQAYVGSKEVSLSAGMSPIEVPLDTEHQVFTDGTPAFMLIVMKNAGLVPRDQWHRPTKRLNKNK